MTSADLMTGKIGKCLELDGTNDYVNVGTGSSLAVTDNITFGAWIKAPSFINHSSILTKFGMMRYSYYGYRLQFYGTNGLLSFDRAENAGTFESKVSTGRVTPGAWNYIQVTKSGTNVSFFINGKNAGTGTFRNSQIRPYTGSFKIGGPDVNRIYFTGFIDEVRVSSVARSADWIAAEYNNQNSPDTFALLSSEEQN
jgi:hypothetical protein